MLRSSGASYSGRVEGFKQGGKEGMKEGGSKVWKVGSLRPLVPILVMLCWFIVGVLSTVDSRRLGAEFVLR
jgi:hypothetical protein